MIQLACILIGLYILGNAIYLGSQSDGENRHCMIAKYVAAGMSGGYLAWLSFKDLIFALVIKDAEYRFISDAAMEILLLLGITIALFMWQDTFWRVIDYLQRKKPDLHLWVLTHFKVTSRRLRE